VLNQLDLEKAEKYYGEYSGYKSYSGNRKHGYTRTYGSQGD
jgi:polysaccharide biosynthesis transport protein